MSLTRDGLSHRSKPLLPLLSTSDDDERKSGRRLFRLPLLLGGSFCALLLLILILSQRPFTASSPPPEKAALDELKALQAEVTRLQSEGARPKPYLLLMIPTVPRPKKGALDGYLQRTLGGIAEQLSSDEADPMFGAVQVMVVSNAEHHDEFDKCRVAFGSRADNAFVFMRNTARELVPDPIGVDDVGDADKPGYIVRRQTRDIVHMLREGVERAPYLMFMEDDWVLCPLALMALHRFIGKAHRRHADFISLRVSHGMNGIVLQNKDALAFADYLEKHQARRPPDHIVIEWFAGETKESSLYKNGRPHFTFRYNLLQHIGATSTLREQRATTPDSCFETIELFPVEAFNVKQCPNDDMWPCPTGGGQGPVWMPPRYLEL